MSRHDDRPRRRRPAPALALAALALTAAACGPEEPGARLEVTPAEVVLPYPGTAVVTLSWLPSAPLDSPTVFAHLLGPDGRVLRTFDHPFPDQWRPGEEVSYPLGLWQSALGPPLPAGVYELTVGIYSPDGRRPALETAGRQVDEGEYAVARIEAPPAPVGGPRLGFGDGWDPPAAADADRQTLGARWLVTDGALEISGLDGPLDLALSVRLPAPDETEQRLVLEPGATEPAVTISSPCAAEPVRAAGAGTHELTMALRPPGDAGSCAVRLDADYVYLDPRTLRRQSVELRRVLWATATAPGAPEAAPAPTAEPTGEPAAETP